MRHFIRLNHSAASFYDILEVSKTSNIKDIKLQFKKLSKKYHPDLNNHLNEEEKKANSEKFIRIVNAYETLKDKRKKEEYDRVLRGGGFGGNTNRGTRGRGFRDEYPSRYSYNNAQKEWEQQYYGAKPYLGASRLNRTRNRVKFDGEYSDENTTFNGQHTNYGDRYNVPHFNYEEHLLKHLKFEQRIINKQLTNEEREAILLQLTKNADILDISEELITKHMMRQVNRKAKTTENQRESVNVNSNSHYMYQKPKPRAYTTTESETDYDDGSTFKALALLTGASGSLYMLYQLCFS